jgi:arsenate reductase-like glutaredoxin family protein
LEVHGIAVQETVPSSRKLGRTEALAMARSAQRLIAAKGKKVITVELQAAPPADDTIAALMLGPTGNLRAPLMRVGQILVVGYNDEAFATVFGS